LVALVSVAKPEPAPLPDDATVIEQDGSRFTIVTAPLRRYPSPTMVTT